MASHRRTGRIGQRTLGEGPAPIPPRDETDAATIDSNRPGAEEDPPGGAAAALRERQRRWAAERARFETAQRAEDEASRPPPG